MSFPIVSLFAGIGGLELGLEAAGVGHVSHQVELDPFCRAVLNNHWPEATQHDDITTLDGYALPRGAVLCGGFPCQDLSAANPGGAGLDGDRSGLWWHYARLIVESEPVAVVFENSPRLVGRGLDQIVAFLCDQGFEVEATRLQVSDAGGPHDRQRVFGIAWHPGRLAHAHGQQLRLEPGRGSWADGTGEAQPRDPGQDGGGGALGHAHREGEPQQGGPLGEERRRVGHAGLGRGGEVAHAAGQRRAEGDVVEQGPTGSPAEGEGPGAAQPEVVRGLHGLPRGLDGWRADRPAWPRGRGPEQHSWEPPRTVAQRSVKGRGSRVKALGNAVSPHVAYIVGCRLAHHLLRAAEEAP